MNNETMMDSSISYRDILEKNKMFIATPIGYSMLPMIRQRLDTVKIVKPNGRLHKYDVILYQRKTGKYILHRIIKVKKDCYYLCGDNQVVVEKGVTDDMIIGVVEGFYQEEKYIPVTDNKYIDYYKKRVKTRKYRYARWFIQKVKSKLFKKRTEN